MNLFISSCYYVLTTLAYSLTGVSFYKITDCFADIKENKLFKLIAFVGLSIIVSVIVYVNDIVNILYTFIAYMIIMILCYKGSIIKKLSAIMVLYPIIVSINLLGNNIDFFYKTSSRSIYYLFWIYLLAFLWFIIYKLIKDKILYAKQYMSDKTWILIDIICLAPLVSIFSATIFTGYNEEYRAYIIAFACITSNIGVMFLIKYIIDSVKVRLDNQNYKLQYDYYKSLEEKQIEIRKLHHDMNNHLQIISTYISNNDSEKAKLYFESIAQKSASYKNKMFCKNSLVNAVLNNKYNIIVGNEIDFNINIAIDNLISIDDMDLCSIFANTLDNAIEASLKIKDPSERKISVKARFDKGYFSYSVTNNKAEDILTSNGSIISSKSDKRHHGFGLQNVQDIVNKYNGTFNVAYTDTEFSLIVIIKSI